MGGGTKRKHRQVAAPVVRGQHCPLRRVVADGSGATVGEVGYTFRKRFDDGWYEGKVTRIRPGAMGGKDRRCIYSDGDSEDLSLEQLQALASMDPMLTKKTSDRSMADIEALFDQKLSLMEQKMQSELSWTERKMQSKIDAMQSEIDALKSELEGKCKYIEVGCTSMERSLKVLANRWECSAPHIPDSHWTEQGFDEGYATEMVHPFVAQIDEVVSNLKDGNVFLDLDLERANDGRHLVHDDALLPHWQNLADALDLYGPSIDKASIDKVGGVLSVPDIPLAPKVLALLTPPLTAVEKFKEINLYRNDFAHPNEGANFAARLVESSPCLETFQWVGNPLDTIDDASCLVEAIKSRPSIRSVRLENCCGANSGVGHQLLTSLLSGNTAYESIDLDSNNIRTLGGTHLSDYLATDPPLKHLHLDGNKLDDNDARLIADALTRNTNLRDLFLRENDITHIGEAALQVSIFDTTSLNSAADSNHTCRIRGVDCFFNGHNRGTNRQKKTYSLLSARNKGEANVHHLNHEFGDDDSLALVPEVLERVYDCSAHWRWIAALAASEAGVRDRDSNEVPPLSIFYELLRGWKMPSLYGNSRGPSSPAL